ncbi:MAG TPA: creatininase family protein [Candidatus Acidoferrales bacterium]|nr:creatininase family protein [Candidatus Acidoferrales bacterium]
MRKLICIAILATGTLSAQQLPTRSMDDLNWMEFRQIVPAKVKTVLVTVGTLEPHGVINNGADNTAPVAIANAIAADVNALIAPHIPYGVTGSMSPYPGALHIPEDVFRAYFRAVMEGMVKNGFRNIVVINGHGGAQTAILNSVASEVALAHNVNTLVINWWSLASDVTLEVFKEDGGHAGINETAFVQAINPKLVHKELYNGKEMATANPAPGTWSAVPAPSSIGLYKEGQGWPKDFDQVKADEYFKKVVAKVKVLVQDTLKKWEMAGFD